MRPMPIKELRAFAEKDPAGYAEFQAELARNAWLAERRSKPAQIERGAGQKANAAGHPGLSLALMPLLIAVVIGVVLWVLIAALVRWVVSQIFG